MKVLGEEYVGKWVALSADQSSVLDSAENLATLCQRLGDQDVIYTRVLDPRQVYAF